MFKLQSFSVNAVVDGDSVGTVKFTAPEEVGPSTAVTVSVDYDGSATFVSISLKSLSRRLREVTYLPSLPANGELFTIKFIETVGSSIFTNGSGSPQSF